MDAEIIKITKEGCNKKGQQKYNFKDNIQHECTEGIL